VCSSDLVDTCDVPSGNEWRYQNFSMQDKLTQCVTTLFWM